MDTFLMCAAYGLGLLVGIVILLMLYFFLQWLYKVVFFNFGYHKVMTSKGLVTNMEYEARHTSSSTPEKNEVYFKTAQAETMIDSDELYQRVRIGESITIQYQERYIKPKYWIGTWELDGYRLLTVTSKLNEVVEFNDPGKPLLPLPYEV